MAARQYKSIVDAKALATAVTTSGQATITLNNITNLPALTAGQTFTLVINPDTTTEEIVTVTSYGSGNVLNVTRGSDGTTAQSSHGTGSVVKHMITPRDLQEPQDHINAASDVHGLATAGPAGASGGNVVGTTASQTLTNKTLTSPAVNTPVVTNGTFSSPAITGGTIAGTVTNSGTISGGTISGGTISGGTISGAGISSSNISFSGGGNLNLGVSTTTALTADTINIKSSEIAALSGVTSGIQSQITGIGSWQTWTPATNSAGWAGTWSDAKYSQIGKTVHFRATYTLTAAAGTTPLNVSIPVAAVAGTKVVLGTGTGVVFGVGNQVFVLNQTTTTAVDIRYLRDYSATASEGTIHSPVTGTAPGTWASGNNVTISGTYEAA